MAQPAFTSQPVGEFTRTLSAVAEQGRNVLDSSFKTYAAEVGALFTELARDDAEAAREISRCHTPFDLLVVQQKWLTGRTEAWVNAGLRLVLGAVHEPEAAAAQAAAFRLPD